MKWPFDIYGIRARLVPAILAGAPALAFTWIFITWNKLGLVHLISGVGLIVLFSAFADIARRRGLAIQPGIMERMGGWPTTVTLRHSDATHDAATKAGFHSFLAARLGEPAPSPEDESSYPTAADSFYARGATWLRENTRDTKKFDILFNENIGYGFRRNLLGLKVPGFLLNAAIIIVCLGILWFRSPVDFSNTFNDKIIAVIVVALIHAAYLALFVTEAGVHEAARAYSRQLLLSTQSPHLNKHVNPASLPPRKTKARKKMPTKA